MARVVELNCFPIKGCAGTSLTHTATTSMGLKHDRSFMVVDAQGVFRSQRRDPLLALIHPEVRDRGHRVGRVRTSPARHGSGLAADQTMPTTGH